MRRQKPAFLSWSSDDSDGDGVFLFTALGRVFRLARQFITAVLLCSSSVAVVKADIDTASFQAYLEQVRVDAVAAGVSAGTVDRAFEGLEPDPRVIKFDRRQPEFVQTFEEYLSARVSDFRKREGRRLFLEHQALLNQVGEKYGVDSEYLVAFWGLETSFGRYQGKYSIIRSLATLGHDQRRSAFFTAELLHALRILDEGHIEPDKFVGAWAGAMGQGQFLPSSFLRFAQDHDGDGKKDIWSNHGDVFASIANYLKEAGWVAGAGWGASAQFPDSLDAHAMAPESVDGRCRALRHHTRKMTLDEWRGLGVKIDSSLNSEGEWALVNPEEGASRSYLVGGNYRAILNYNCANKYAVSVGLLADWIVGVNPESS